MALTHTFVYAALMIFSMAILVVKGRAARPSWGFWGWGMVDL